MPLSPLRQHAAPVQDAPRKISTPLQPHSRASFHKRSPASTHQAPATHPAVGSATGHSGFDGQVKLGGGPQLNPQGTDPLATGTQGTTSTQAVSSLDSKGLDALFNRASQTYENILTSLGHSLQPIEDPTARLLDRSTYLGNLLTADPSLKSQIKQSDIAQVSAFSRLFLQLQPSLEGDRRVAADAYLRTASMLCAEWPPPPGRGL